MPTSTHDNEDADPVGTPVPEATRRAAHGKPAVPPATDDAPPTPRGLDQEKEDFTSEGAPPPGKVATRPPALPDKDAVQGRKG